MGLRVLTNVTVSNGLAWSLDGATLYITTARRGLDATQLAQFPESGGILACRPGERGLAADVFRG